MFRFHAAASSLIRAPAGRVYAIIADYGNGHNQILPKPYFRSMEVEQGGIGGGTIIRFQMQVLGTTRTFRSAISEPEPGRLLVETDLETNMVTTFSVDPHQNGQQAYVTIITEGETGPGLAGLLERFLTPAVLRRIYVRELALLAAYATERVPD